MSDRLKNYTILLASGALQKVDATVAAYTEVMPLHGMDRIRGRRVIVYREAKDGIHMKVKRQGLEKVIPRRLLRGVGSVLPRENRLTVVALKAPSSVPEQPIVERRRDIEQGFKGAVNRLKAAIEANATLEKPFDWDEVVGIENAQVAMTAPEGQDAEIDVGFVVVQNKAGDQGLATSAGVIFGTQLGQDYFAKSQETGFTIPAGHFRSPENPQDPHDAQTRGFRPRVPLLTDAIIIAHTSLP